MIEKLKIKNFKSIDTIEIKFKKLNVLCGENASGKTSIIHAILLCSQNNKDGKDVDGEIIKIGNYEELKNNTKNGEIKIEISNRSVTKTIVYKRNDNPDLNQDYVLTVEPKEENNSYKFEESIFYLSSDRTGAMDTYQKGNYLFGTNGSGSISFLHKYQENLMNAKYMEKFKQKYKESDIVENRKFIEHVRFWMEDITGEDISISSIDRTNQYILTYGVNKVRPINTGSGYSFLLPIVIACLGSIIMGKENPTIIIENPEIFLHPEAQRKLMCFLNFCKNFCQIIIETHSEHIIKNAIEGKNIDTQILVFERNEKGYTNKNIYNGRNFKTKSYLEIIYKAFGIVVPEFHILLYGLVQLKYNKSIGVDETTIKVFDNYLNTIIDVNRKTWQHKQRNGSIVTYQTLPTYIRNKIDHPEAKNPTNNRVYNMYTELELLESIEFLLNQL